MKGNEWVAIYQIEVKSNEAEKYGNNQHRVSERVRLLTAKGVVQKKMNLV